MKPMPQEEKKKPNLMRYILPCLKNASKAASYYSAVIEQCFQQSKHFTEAPENRTPKKLTKLTGEEAGGNSL